MGYIAHTENDAGQIQSYRSHVLGTLCWAEKILADTKPHMSESDFRILRYVVLTSLIWHDLGKLCDFDQEHLNNPTRLHLGQLRKMPNHTDAGAAYMLSQKERVVAWLVQSHHLGFKDSFYSDLRDYNKIYIRSPWVDSDQTIAEYMDDNLTEIVRRHHEEVKTIDLPALPDIEPIFDIEPELARIALGIIARADHSDTADHYNSLPRACDHKLHSKRRLEQLVKLVREQNAKAKQSDRNQLRQAIFEAIINRSQTSLDDAKIWCLASEVGFGKTFSALAFALTNNPSKIVYVAPFINIITQTVADIRKKLQLPGESEEAMREVVAEIHSRLNPFTKDGQIDELNRSMNVMFDSPIICMTAVHAFESFGSSRTRRTKEMSTFAGAFFIIDESAQCMSAKLWSITLKWVQYMAKNFGCKFLFASGTMTKPWKIKQIKKLSGFTLDVPSVISEELSQKTLQFEKDRVKLLYRKERITSTKMLSDMTSFYVGPKIIVCGTRHNAARIASDFRHKLGKDKVMLVSNSLSPADAEKTLKTIRTRVKNKEDFVVVATTYISTGVNLSFRYGFTENLGLLMTEQIKGRIRRENESEWNDSFLQIFELSGPDFNVNPAFLEQARLFRELWKEELVGPEHSQLALQKEVESMGNVGSYSQKQFITLEESKNLRIIDDLYKLIADPTMHVIVNPSLLDGPISWRQLGRHSVTMYENQFNTFLEEGKIELCEVELNGDLVHQPVWRCAYDAEFLGIYAGIL